MGSFSIVYDGTHGRQIEKDIPLDTRHLNLSHRMAHRIDLTKVRECSVLETIDLSRNQLKSIDLSPLEEVASLKRLRLDHNHLLHVDLWPLRNLDNLEEIDLSMNRMPSINLSPVIHHVCVRLDEGMTVNLDHTLRYVLSGKDTTRISLCTPEGSRTITSPRITWVKYEQLIEAHGWRKVRDSILHFIDKLGPRKWFRLQKGILEGFDMPELAGLDGDPRQLIQGVDDEDDFYPLQQSIYDRAIELVEQQLQQGGSTLFFDAHRMTHTRASKLVPLLVSARELELQDISVHVGGNRVNLFPLWMTHYGSELLGALNFGLTTDMKGLALIRTNIEQLGYELDVMEVALDGPVVPERFSKGLLDYVYSIASIN